MLVMTAGELRPAGHDLAGSASRRPPPPSSAPTWSGGASRTARSRPGRRPSTFIDAVVRTVEADVIYAHAPNDSHQDHVAVSAAALAAARRLGRVLYYQSPSTTSFDPTVFVDVGGRPCRASSPRCAPTGRRSCSARWSTSRRSRSARRYWGSRAKTCYAEAFETPRFLWDIGALPAARASPVADHRARTPGAACSAGGMTVTEPARRDRPAPPARCRVATSARAVDVPLTCSPGSPSWPARAGRRPGDPRRRHRRS